ncbi:MAG: hypothetical protein JJO71_10285 [Escherichia coli]|nr:hypothetical protein [Escherichia coli]MBL0989745.1 hypothetical protein [Escherichia coli]MBL0999232.1 hypothetical protein [Escherichia coli]MBL1004042.1 hypothetical protein [Escherichia coli]
MKQIDKLLQIASDPRPFGLRKNTRVYNHIIKLLLKGVANTGYSDKRTYHVETSEVHKVLAAAGISHKYYNNAPCGGACGEHVELLGRVRHDALDAVKSYVTANAGKYGGKFFEEWKLLEDYENNIKSAK